MINEIYQLTESLNQHGIVPDSWHKDYRDIPVSTPCIRIVVSEGKIKHLEEISDSLLLRKIRKFGDNQKTFPALNIPSLYKVLADDPYHKALETAQKEGICELTELELSSCCHTTNWNEKAERKVSLCLNAGPDTIQTLMKKGNTFYPPFETLFEEVKPFQDPKYFFHELQSTAFKLLQNKVDTSLALRILFFVLPKQKGKQPSNEEDTVYNLSIVFDSEKLIQEGTPTIGDSFSKGLNNQLINAEKECQSHITATDLDAFGVPLALTGERITMPKVKLGAGLEVSLRTMFREQQCQNRYHRIEDESYPISPTMRDKIKDALYWMGSPDYQEITWTRLGKDEVLFAYPSIFPVVTVSFVGWMGNHQQINGKQRFEKAAERFIKEIKTPRNPGAETKSNLIETFVLCKVDKARTKVVYSYGFTPSEMESRSEEWSLGCHNLPTFDFGDIETPFPLDIPEILNNNWHCEQGNKNSIVDDMQHLFPNYYGLQLLFRDMTFHERGLSFLTNKLTKSAQFVLKIFKEHLYKGEEIIKQSLPLLGLLLYQRGIRKESYMLDYPYLLGQLLKISDQLHLFFCKVVRDNSIPSQLAGSGLYMVASEQPSRALAQLGQRMLPYINWARAYRAKNIEDEGKKSSTAGWLLSAYEKTADLLVPVLAIKNRFSDEEKAQLFIGYLAALPQKEENTKSAKA